MGCVIHLTRLTHLELKGLVWPQQGQLECLGLLSTWSPILQEANPSLLTWWQKVPSNNIGQDQMNKRFLSLCLLYGSIVPLVKVSHLAKSRVSMGQGLRKSVDTEGAVGGRFCKHRNIIVSPWKILFRGLMCPELLFRGITLAVVWRIDPGARVEARRPGKRQL